MTKTRHIGPGLIGLGLMTLALPPAHADEDTTLTVSPSICLLAPGEKTCRMNVVLRWQSRSTRFACLVRLARDGTLRCWQDAERGDFRDVHEAADTTRYSLTGREDETLATAEVDVLAVQPTDRRRARRNRHVWDLL